MIFASSEPDASDNRLGTTGGPPVFFAKGAGHARNTPTVKGFFMNWMMKLIVPGLVR